TNLVLCKQGMGALFSMEDMVRRRIGDDDTLKREGLYMVRLNITGSRFTVALFYKKDKTLNKAEKAFVLFAKDYFSN
nr:hypothetical protein [Eubacterium sp.]